MDNKITKSRLSNLFAYDWIWMIVVIIAAIVGWELLYTTTAPSLAFGQTFYYYIDENMYSGSRENLKSCLNENSAFSYDVLAITNEIYASAQGGVDILSVRIMAKEIDCIVTNTVKEKKENGEYSPCRANSLIDNSSYGIGSIDLLYDNACRYLSCMLKTGETDYLSFENLDKNIIKERFLKRSGRDNRYRAGLISEQDEYGRIEKLCNDVKAFKAILEYDESQTEENKIFYSYTRYEQIYNTATEESVKNNYKEPYEKETAQRYALKIETLPSADGKLNSTEYFRYADGRTTSKDAVIIFVDYIPDNFNFETDTKYDLQFEKISFMDCIVKSFSDILD